MKFKLSESISVLERTPKVMKSLLEGLSDAWTAQNEGPETWSPYDVIGHLVHGEETDWLPRIKIILSTSENKTFDPYDRFAQFELSKGKSMQQLLDEFESLRQSNMKELRELNLTKEQLQMQGIHPELGPVTLSQVLSAWVVHDLGHIVQISRVMAKQYKDEVGPWPQYLTVLNS
ncbi:MAG: DinB family protein [Flavobacteriaceae bacterium]|nr:DinB family protein [Flavobacteriaceae bacterium]